MVICDHDGFLQKRLRQIWSVVVTSLYLAVALSSGQALADSPPVQLDGPVSSAELVGHVDHLIDAGWDLTVAQAMGPKSDDFAPIRSKNPDFGYTRDRIWLRAKVENTTATQADWLIYFPENFKQQFRVMIVHEDGRIDIPLELTETSPFSARPIPHPQMVAPMTLEPGASATILISLWSEGSSYITFSFETPESFATLTATATAKNFVFYGMMLLLITAALVLMVFLGNWTFLAYSAYAASGLLFIMHADGVAFQYLWPDYPALNNKASIFAGSGIIVFGAIYARVFLRTRKLHPVLDKILLAIIGATLLLDLALYFPNPQLLKKVLVFMSLVAISTFATAAVVAALSNFREVRFYLIAWTGAVISAVLLNLNHLFGVELEQSLIYDSIRATMVFDAGMMGLAILDRYNQLRQSQRTAMEARLQETERNLELSARLSRLSENYEAMTTVARARDEQIQNTVHDLRQPVHALRLKVKDMIDNAGSVPNDTSQVEATFTYLEELISDYLSGDTPSHDSGLAEPEAPIALGQILDSIIEMFIDDARNKGIDLKLNYTVARTDVDPLAIMRIVSNLVSNAVRYTTEGHVHIDARPEGGKVVISVSDTGPGLTAEEFERAQGRDVRLAEKSGKSEGFGLGLSIAHDLARKNAIGLHIVEQPNGTRIDVTLPAAKASA